MHILSVYEKLSKQHMSVLTDCELEKVLDI